MLNRIFYSVLIFAILAPSVWLLAQSEAQKLPEGKGRELLTSGCEQCHGLEGTVNQRHSLEEWKDLVNSMVSQGAPLSDEEVDTLSEYLAKNFGSTDSAGASKDSKEDSSNTKANEAEENGR